MGNPTVSVILPVYNGEKYLRFAIESVLNQTLQDFELIIIDDGSVDSSAEIVREYGQRVKYVSQENTGVAGAFNHGLRQASGRYISWLSHDDVYLSEKLEKQVAALDRLGSPAVCYTDVEMIGSVGEVLGELRMPEYDRGGVLRHILTGGPICTASYSLMYNRSCIDEVGFYSEYWKYTQDAEMLMRLAKRFPLIRIPQTLVQVRDHGERGISSKYWKREVVRFFREHLRMIPLDELFPEGPDPGEAYQWLGDMLARRSYPIYRVAYTEYWQALRERPSRCAQLLARTVLLNMREVYEILMRAVKAVPSLDRAVRQIKWRIPSAAIPTVPPVSPRKTDH